MSFSIADILTLVVPAPYWPGGFSSVVPGLPVLCAPGASFFELSVAGGEDGWGAPFKHILGSDKADGAVQAHGRTAL